MGISRRKRKTRRKLEDSESRDIISSLPDELLGKILSCLPTKYAVATTVLSSRWKNLYKHTTTLDFDDSTYLYPRKNLGNGRRNDNASFREFVNKVLGECKSKISKFRLKCGDNIEFYLIHDWINAVFTHKIAEFELSVLDMRIPCVLQLCKLNCENLVVLRLDGELILRVPKSVTFPRLQVLVFKGIMFHGSSSIRFNAYCKSSSDNHSLNGILLGCPLLKELVIEGCDWNGGDLYFTNPLLRSLTFHAGIGGPLDQLNGCTIYMDLPNLVQFNYFECLAEQYEIRNLNSVREAQVDIHFNDDEFEEQDLCDAILDLITGVYCCQSLHLSSQCLEALTSGEFELPIFRNLTQLTLALGYDVSWNDVLLDFLNSSPSLESLTLVQGFLQRWQCSQPDDDEFLIKDEEVPPCVKFRLKFINIKDFRGFKGEMQMIIYFLENANILEEMVLHWDKRKRAKKFAAKEEEILELAKSSESCTIAFK
ncbi:hypothetical protein RDABS01_032088 [Bienertia sinuspersici]